VKKNVKGINRIHIHVMYCCMLGCYSLGYVAAWLPVCE